MWSKRKIKKTISTISFIILLVVSLFNIWQSLTNQDQVLGEQAPETIDQRVAAKQEIEIPADLGELDNRSFEKAVVTRVIDGDTVELSDGRKLRYIGIDTPETKHPRVGQECFGKEASQRNRALVEGKVVYLEKDVSDTDRYGRLLRYVWLDDVLVNKQLVTEGFAYSASFPPDIAKQEEFKTAQANAREHGLGLWGICELNDTEAINDLVKESP